MFLRRIRDLREDSDRSQKYIANILNMNTSVYSRYERGFRTIPLPHLIKLADYNNTSLDYLVGRTSNPLPPHDLAQP